MRRTAGHFYSTIFAGVVLGGIAVAFVSTPFAFAEETGSPTSASTDGGTNSSASSGGTGSSTAGIGSSTNSTAQLDNTSSTAETQTGGGGVAVNTGPDGTTAAAAGTNATAGASSNGTDLTAWASANAGAGAGAVGTNADGLATAATTSGATAVANGGANPSAYTNAGSGVFALAVGGARGSRTAVASAGDNSLFDNSDDDEYTITIAYTTAGNYSVAIAGTDRATAFSSTFGDASGLTVSDIMAAARTAAYAWASAGRTDAAALAGSKARGFATNGNGWAAAASASRAGARVQIQITNSGGFASSSPDAVAGRCVVKVKNNKLWKALKWSQRRQVVMCNCPTTGILKGKVSKWCPKNGPAIFTAELRR